VAEPLRELAAADINRVDASSPALEQDVGEATRRSADVEADTPRRPDREGVESRRELVPAARDIRLRLDDLDGDRGVEEVARFAIRARRVALPHPDLAGHDEGLRPRARLHQAALDEQLVES
jgi:hypothetical protein